MDTEPSTTSDATKPVPAKPAPKGKKRSARRAVKTGKVVAKKTKKPAAKKPAPKKPAAKKVSKKPAAKKAKKTAAATRAPRAALSGIPNKAEFIRQFSGLSAKEVVARAAELGAVITESYVYNTRGLQKKGGKSKTATVKRVPLTEALNGAGVHTVHTTLTPATVEDLFYAVVAEIGTVKAVHMLMASQDLVKAALAGARG